MTTTAKKPKIFGIGLSKTGTSSLAHALEILGYRTKDYPGIQRYLPGDVSCVDPALLDQYDALTDTPIPSFYKELDRAYPGSKFILTVRDMDGWLLSCKKQFTENLARAQNEAHTALFMDLYGCTVFDETKFRTGYERFVQGVMEYFKGRPQDLLVLNVTAGEGWDKLCPFLGKPIPDMPFPKANVTRIRWMDVHALEHIAREAGDTLQRIHRMLTAEAGETPWYERLTGLPRQAYYALRGGKNYAQRIAIGDVEHMLARNFARLNSEIPIVFRSHHDTDYDVRKKWNHFWLVDPLDGEAAFGAKQGNYSLNIALIEDRRPVAGVVYAPQSGIAYYGMVGKGVYKASRGGSRIRLDQRETGSEGGVDNGGPNPSTDDSVALRLCRMLFKTRSSSLDITASMEWHTAAPHALARLVGCRIESSESGDELSYNKPDWRNPPIKVTPSA